jgi:hypothetical protein
MMLWRPRQLQPTSSSASRHPSQLTLLQQQQHCWRQNTPTLTSTRVSVSRSQAYAQRTKLVNAAWFVTLHAAWWPVYLGL